MQDNIEDKDGKLWRNKEPRNTFKMDHKTFNNNFSDVDVISNKDNDQFKITRDDWDLISETSYMSTADDIEFSLKNKYEHKTKINENLILKTLKYFRSNKWRWETLKDWDNYRVRVCQSGTLMSNQHPVYWIQIRVKLVNKNK